MGLGVGDKRGRTYTDEQRGDSGKLWVKLNVFVPAHVLISPKMDVRLNELVHEKFTNIFVELQEKFETTHKFFQPPPTQVRIDTTRSVFVQLHTNSSAKALKLASLRQRVGVAVARAIDVEAREEWEAEQAAMLCRVTGQHETPPDDDEYRELRMQLALDPPTDEDVLAKLIEEPCGPPSTVRWMEQKHPGARHIG